MSNMESNIKVFYGVRIRKTYQNLDLPLGNNQGKKNYHKSDLILVKTNRGEEIGEVVIYPVCAKNRKKILSELQIKQIIRKAEADDLQKYATLDQEETQLRQQANDFLDKSNKDVRIFAVEIIYDRKTAYLYYKNLNENKKISLASLNPLLEYLKGKYPFQIELKEKGGRGEAKQLGGAGVCGKKLCCVSHLTNYRSVSIKAMKKQNLTINTYKMSGPCDKLQCCMNYEVEMYEQ